MVSDADPRPKIAAIGAHAVVDQQGKIDMKALKLVATAFACLMTVSPALAEGEKDSGGPFQPIDAQPMIDACWEATYEQRLDVYAAREGILLSALCLEDRIVEQIEALVPPESLSSDQAAQHLRDTRMAYGLLVWKIYNAHKRCPRDNCGVIYQTAHVSAVATLMESLLRETVKQRNELKL